MTMILLAEKKFAEAEPLTRECLIIREKKVPDDWLAFNSRSMLGGSLLGRKKFTEAEPLLLSAYAGMREREDRIPPNDRPRLKEALQRVLDLYTATDQAEKVAEWQKRLRDFEQAGTDKKAAAP